MFKSFYFNRTIEPPPAAVATAVMAKPAQAGPAVVTRRHQQGGFCEICECPFTDLYDHISSRFL